MNGGWNLIELSRKDFYLNINLKPLFSYASQGSNKSVSCHSAMEADGHECTQLGNKTPGPVGNNIGFLVQNVQIVTDFLFIFYFSKISLLN